MRYLTIVRHAAATRIVPGQRDVDRELSARGRRQCAQLRQWAMDEGELGRFGPAVAVVSCATRTRETWRLALEGTRLVAQSYVSDRIYNGVGDVEAADVLSELEALDDGATSMIVVAHSPTVYELLCTLVDERPTSLRDGYPLAGAYVVALARTSPLSHAHGSLVASYVPH